jgi:ATP-binding cassette subfamily B protein
MTKLLVRYLKPYRLLVVLIVLCTLAQVGSQLYLPRLMSDIVDVGIARKGADAAGSMGTDAVQMHYLLVHGGRMLAITLAAGLAAIAAGFLCSRVSAALGRDLREKIFARVEAFSLVEFGRFSTASLIIRSTNDIQQIQQMSFMLLRLALMSPCFVVVAFGLAIAESRQLSWIFVVAMPLLVLIMLFTMRFVMPIFRRIQKKTDHLNLVAREGLTGVRVIRAFNRQTFQQERFRAANDDLTDDNIRVNRMMITLFPVVMFLMQLTSVAIVWFGSKLIVNSGLEVGSMMAFMQYAMQVLFSFMFLAMILVMLPRASVSAERVTEVLDTQPVILNPPETDKEVSASIPAPSLVFDRVTFSYGQASEEPALREVSFQVRAGTTLAIIGSTGAGKSTLLNLIERLYDVTSGSIVVSGRDVRAYRQHELHERIGYVPQKAVLFSGTIADNIRFGKGEATDDEVVQALKTAQAWEFVRELEEGINAPVVQDGANFSGGQRQRLAIARALIKKPELYLFDDSFSALDLTTDALLRAALKPLMENSVQLIVAQRISTIADADQIVVLDEGQVCGLGTHRQLLAENKVYQEIASSQLTEEEIAHA